MRRALPLLAAVALAACGTAKNEDTGAYATLAEFEASDFAKHRYLPDQLLPRSARNVAVTYHRDSHLVEAEFDFAPPDHDALVLPFLSFDQLSLRLAIQHGAFEGAPLPAPSLMLRCRPGPMEYLQIARPGHARYWTESDPARRAQACGNNAMGTL